MRGPYSAFERGSGRRVLRAERVGGGAAGSVDRVHLDDGTARIAKRAAAGLDIEARSVRLLAERSALPVPRIDHADPTLLVMEELPGSPGVSPEAEPHAAAILGALHAVASPEGRYGLDFDNTIGPLRQPNGWAERWPEFWRERRILPMAEAARREGVLPAGLHARTLSLAGRLEELLPEAPAASLIHGDIWSGNILSAGARITGLIDPAPSYSHAEVELAFLTMFGTVGERFFRGYFDAVPPSVAERGGFERVRRDVYLLYPLLTHVRIYRGGSYLGGLADALDGLGF